MKYLVICFFFLFSLNVVAQRYDKCEVFGSIFIESSKTYADVIIYIEEYEELADILIFKESNKLFADESGSWYFVENKNFADFTVFITNDKRYSDFSIFYSDSKNFTGCK